MNLISKQVSSEKVNGWCCNISTNASFKTDHPYTVSVKKRGYSQYALMVALLQTGNFQRIIFDCDLDREQANYLGELQQRSKTELIHARIAQQFNRLIA